jgi:hypothetical protein
VFFSDGSQTISLTKEEGSVEVKGGWVVVTEGDRVRQFPARVVSYIDTRS